MTKKIYFGLIIFSVFVGLLTFSSSPTVGKQESPSLQAEVAAPIFQSAEAPAAAEIGVVTVSSQQVCKTRMGCGCKHGRGDTDSLKKHHPEEDPYDDQNSWSPHLDIKCTRCNSKWYCPVWKRFRD